jgi:hypothetical protein
MKKRTLFPMLFLAFSFEAKSQTTYLMACRGVHRGFSILESSYGVMKLTVPFTKGKVPADQGIPGGTCTWMDRGLFADEPQKLYYEFSANQHFTMLINLGDNTAMSTGAPSTFTHNPIIDAMSNLHYSGFLYYFWVYNVDNQYFKVVRLGP